VKSGVAPKDQLLQTAARLFYREGYRAVGVDLIAAESGIGKMTLYRHYPSKDDLIVAYLEASDRQFWRHFERSTEGRGTAREQLLAFFEGLQTYCATPECYGCPFLNIASEYPAGDYAGHQVALAHKHAVQARFAALAGAAGARDAQALASGLILLMDGAYMAARLFGSRADSPAGGVADAARVLIDSQVDATGP
jgi:AcrR family transcriptional regulator